MSSVDGRVDVGRWSEPFGGRSRGELAGVYARLGASLGTDAWMFGLNTARAFLPERFSGKSLGTTVRREAWRAPRRSERLFVFADPEAGTGYGRVRTVRGDDIAVILPENVTDEYLAHLRSHGVSYLFGGTDGTDLCAAMTMLGSGVFGVRRLSLQGGGIIDGAMLAAGLLDELSLVVYPGIDGLSGAASIFEYTGKITAGPARGQSLELISAQTCDHGVVWLRYRFHRNNDIR